MESPSRRGKVDPIAFYAQRSRDLKITAEDVLKCSRKIPGKKCKDCDETAVQSNRGYCTSCAAYWIPKENEPGSAMLGSEFMFSNTKPYNKVLCPCGKPLCHQIGYCQRGRVRLPVDPT